MVTATTAQGRIEGVERGGVLRFAGVPFAAPPVGERRFRRPEPHEGWTGVRDCTAFGPTSVQNVSPLTSLLGEEEEPISEDCLFLNVFTPALDEARRPVMVWIHGGGFFMGSGSSPMYEGSALVRRGDVVLVSLNYRLGALGFLYLDDLANELAGSGNLGILDQVAALEWVRDNIASFGGDPENVTIFGESAGGMSVGTLLGLPAARGLFHKAIPQSGAAHNVSPTKFAAEVRDEFFSRLGGGLDKVLEAGQEEILHAQGDFFLSAFADIDARLSAGRDPVLLPFQPVADDHVLPEAPIDAVRSGHAAEVPLLVGTTLEEWKLFALLDPSEIDEDLLIGRLTRVAGAEAADVYRSELPGADHKDLFGAAVTDYVFRQPAIRLAELQSLHQPRTFMYLFTWRSPAMGGLLGSCHALDVPFVFGNHEGGLAMFLGEEPPEHLGRAVQDSWLAFARNGNPSCEALGEWPAYGTGSRMTMELGDRCGLLEDPERPRRELWSTIL